MTHITGSLESIQNRGGYVANRTILEWWSGPKTEVFATAPKNAALTAWIAKVVRLEETGSSTTLEEDFHNSENDFNNIDGVNTEELKPISNELIPVKNKIDKKINKTINTEKKFHKVRQSFGSKRYRIQEVIKPNQIILVQVIKDERGKKGAALTTFISLAGKYTV